MKWKHTPGAPRENIDDRRYTPPPSDPNALLYGLPQTPAEWAAYKSNLARMAALKANGGVLPERTEGDIAGGQVLPEFYKPKRTERSDDLAGLEWRRREIQDEMDRAARGKLNGGPSPARLLSPVAPQLTAKSMIAKVYAEALAKREAYEATHTNPVFFDRVRPGTR